MKLELTNGWTKEKLISKIREHVPEGGAFANHACFYDLGVKEYDSTGRCAIGACMPGTPGEDPWFNHDGAVVEVMEDYPQLWEDMPFTDIEVLGVFQGVHDRTCALYEKKNVTEVVVDWIEAHVE